MYVAVCTLNIALDNIMRSGVKDCEKCRRILRIFPRPLSFVCATQGITKQAQTLELQGEVVLVLTYTEFSDNADLDDLGKATFWPQGRIPEGHGESSICGTQE